MSDNKEIESRLVVKPPELQEEIKELEAEDKSIASLLEDEEEKEKVRLQIHRTRISGRQCSCQKYHINMFYFMTQRT